MKEHTRYWIFNPYQHLTEPFRVTKRQWEYLLENELTQYHIDTLERGGVVTLGKCIKIWKERSNV